MVFVEPSTSALPIIVKSVLLLAILNLPPPPTWKILAGLFVPIPTLPSGLKVNTFLVITVPEL